MPVQGEVFQNPRYSCDANALRTGTDQQPCPSKEFGVLPTQYYDNACRFFRQEIYLSDTFDKSLPFADTSTDTDLLDEEVLRLAVLPADDSGTSQLYI